MRNRPPNGNGPARAEAASRAGRPRSQGAESYSQAQRELLELTGIRVWTSSSPADSSDNAGSEGIPLGTRASRPRRGQDALAPGVSGESSASATERPPGAPKRQEGASQALPTATAERPELAALRSKVAACTACPLHAGRRQTVFGVGNPNADWMFVGEGPGEEEDRRGEPFVGRAGKLLDAMLRAMGLDRTTVYIANIVKCRPPNNRNPSLEEATTCIPFLRRQIELVAPRLIVALGAVAAQRLLETNRPVGAMRGQIHHLAQPVCPVLVTYHPAYLLRSPGQKGKAWEDLQLAMREMEAMLRDRNVT